MMADRSAESAPRDSGVSRVKTALNTRRDNMAVTLSSKYQVVIPKDVRDLMGLKAGMQFDFLTYGNIIRLIPVPPIQEMEGFLKGKIKDSTIEREEEDRLWDIIGQAPAPPIPEMEGFLTGKLTDSTIEREEEDRL
jgi:AbrB family looped-hinge helix DNA binding protein